MIYFENAMWGSEGFNTHLIAYTLCLSLSKFLDRDFFFDYEIPSSTPPEFVLEGQHKDKFKILLDSKRSLVSELLDMPARRHFDVDRSSDNKITIEALNSRFLTTEAIKSKYFGSIVWDSFAVGRICLVKEELQAYDIIEVVHASLVNPSYFYFLARPDKKALLEGVRIRYLAEIEDLAKRIVGDLGKFNAVHLRLGDFIEQMRDEGFLVEIEKFKEYAKANFIDESLPILIATDGLNEKEIFAGIFPNGKLLFIDEVIFDHYASEFAALKFTDFNVLTILNQLICANAEIFIGTYRSTFTSIIHRLRQERNGRLDFNFFPDQKVSKLLNSENKIVPDRQGFFDWNRYSVFSEQHRDMSWMREWNFDLTSVELN